MSYKNSIVNYYQGTMFSYQTQKSLASFTIYAIFSIQAINKSFVLLSCSPLTSLFAAHSLGNICRWHIYPHLVYSQDDLLWLIVPKSQWMVRNVDGNYLLSVELTDILWRTTTLYGRLEWWSEFKRFLYCILLGAFHAWCRKMLRCLI